MAFFRVRVTCRCSTTSSKVWGRHLRAVTWYPMCISCSHRCQGGREMIVHPPSTSQGEARHPLSASVQALLRHPETFVYGCFLPDLTGFTTLRCTGPNPQRLP